MNSYICQRAVPPKSSISLPRISQTKGKIAHPARLAENALGPDSEAMNYFTQTVDSSLWFSRAFDDAEYDESVSAEILTPNIALTANAEHEYRVVAFLTNSIANILIKTYSAKPLQIVGNVDALTIYSIGPAVALIAVPDSSVPDENAVSWAKAVLDVLSPQRVIILTSMPKFHSRTSSDDVLPLLALGSPLAGVQTEPMQPPALLDGVAAALASEALFRRLSSGLCVYIERASSVGLACDSLLRLSHVLDCEIGARPTDDDLRQRQQRNASQTRVANIASRGNSLYT